MLVSKWNDKRLRVGWTIRMSNGKLAIVTWISPTGGYMAKPIEQGEAARIAAERGEYGDGIGLNLPD